MKWASTVTEEPRLDVAAPRAAQRIVDELGRLPDLAIVFASAHHRSHFPRLPSLLADQLGDCPIVGCSGGGVIGGGREVEERPGLSITAAALPGVTVRTRHLLQTGLPPTFAPIDAWREALGVTDVDPAGLIILSDPYSFATEPFLHELDRVFPDAVKIGGLASGGRNPGEHALFADGLAHRSGAVCLTLAGSIRIDSVVSQGCRPIGEPFFVTRARGNLLLELDGRRPVDAIRTLLETLKPHDQALSKHSLFLGVAMRETQTQYLQGDYLIRNLIATDPSSGALWIGAELKEQNIVQFHLRDAETAAYDLEQALARLDRLPEWRRPSGSLLFSCLGRGLTLYGQPDHDTHAFRRHVGDVPLGGFFCNGEIGPVQGRTFVHGYTSAFALFAGDRSDSDEESSHGPLN
jgi:small ligand-binding sensory domain FIST